MAEPLKDFGRLAIDPRDHRVLSRIARARGVTQHDLAREILGVFVAKAIHDAKVVLGQDDDNDSATGSRGAVTGSRGAATGDDGVSRSATERGRR